MLAAETIKNRTAAKSLNDVKRVHGFSRMSLNAILQKVGELTHHDTITGTSLKSVVVREASDIYRNLSQVHLMSGHEVLKRAMEDEGFNTSSYRLCVHDMNDRRYCPGDSSNIYLTK